METTAYNGISSSVDTHTDTEQAVEYGYLANEEMQHQLHVRYDTEADVDEETRGNVNNVLAGLNIVYDESSGLLGIVKDQNDGRAVRSSDDNKSDGGKDKKKTDSSGGNGVSLAFEKNPCFDKAQYSNYDDTLEITGCFTRGFAMMLGRTRRMSLVPGEVGCGVDITGYF